MITQREIECGEVRATAEDKIQREREVKEYNDRAYALRKLKDRQMDLQGAYIGVNLLLTSGLVYALMRGPYSTYVGPTGYMIVGVNFLAALFLVFKMNNLKLAVAVSLLLLYIDWVFAFIVAVNAVIMLRHDSLVKKLREEPGYPEFRALRLAVKEEETPPAVYRPLPSQAPVQKPAQPQNFPNNKPDGGGMMEI